MDGDKVTQLCSTFDDARNDEWSNFETGNLGKRLYDAIEKFTWLKNEAEETVSSQNPSRNASSSPPTTKKNGSFSQSLKKSLKKRNFFRSFWQRVVKKKKRDKKAPRCTVVVKSEDIEELLDVCCEVLKFLLENQTPKSGKPADEEVTVNSRKHEDEVKEKHDVATELSREEETKSKQELQFDVGKVESLQTVATVNKTEMNWAEVKFETVETSPKENLQSSENLQNNWSIFDEAKEKCIQESDFYLQKCFSRDANVGNGKSVAAISDFYSTENAEKEQVKENNFWANGEVDNAARLKEPVTCEIVDNEISCVIFGQDKDEGTTKIQAIYVYQMEDSAESVIDSVYCMDSGHFCPIACEMEQLSNDEISIEIVNDSIYLYEMEDPKSEIRFVRCTETPNISPIACEWKQQTSDESFIQTANKIDDVEKDKENTSCRLDDSFVDTSLCSPSSFTIDVKEEVCTSQSWQMLLSEKSYTVQSTGDSVVWNLSSGNQIVQESFEPESLNSSKENDDNQNSVDFEPPAEWMQEDFWHLDEYPSLKLATVPPDSSEIEDDNQNIMDFVPPPEWMKEDFWFLDEHPTLNLATVPPDSSEIEREPMFTAESRAEKCESNNNSIENSLTKEILADVAVGADTVTICNHENEMKEKLIIATEMIGEEIKFKYNVPTAIEQRLVLENVGAESETESEKEIHEEFETVEATVYENMKSKWVSVDLTKEICFEEETNFETAEWSSVNTDIGNEESLLANIELTKEIFVDVIVEGDTVTIWNHENEVKEKLTIATEMIGEEIKSNCDMPVTIEQRLDLENVATVGETESELVEVLSEMVETDEATVFENTQSKWISVDLTKEICFEEETNFETAEWSSTNTDIGNDKSVLANIEFSPETSICDLFSSDNVKIPTSEDSGRTKFDTEVQFKELSKLYEIVENMVKLKTASAIFDFNEDKFVAVNLQETTTCEEKIETESVYLYEMAVSKRSMVAYFVRGVRNLAFGNYLRKWAEFFVYGIYHRLMKRFWF